MNTDEFLKQFEAALLLQGNLNSRLEALNRAEPPLGTKRAERRRFVRWHEKTLKIREDFRQWGEACYALLEKAPAEVMELNPEIVQAREQVAATLAKHST